MSQPKPSLDQPTLTTLVDLARARIPAGQPVTLEAVETAMLLLLRDIGPQVAAATLTDDLTVPADLAQPPRGKKGHRRTVPAAR